MSDFQITFDLRAALQELAALKSEMTAIRAEMGRVSQAGKGVFSRTQTEAEAIAAEIVSVQREYKRLQEAATILRSALQNQFEPEAAERYAAALVDVEAAILDVEQVSKPLGVTFEPPKAVATAEAAQVADLPNVSAFAREIEQIQSEYNQLTKDTAILRQVLAATFDPTEAKKYADAIAEAEKSIAALESKGRGRGLDLPKGLDEFNQKASLGSEIAGELFGQFTKVALIAEGVRQLAGFASEAVRLSEGYKKTEVAFSALLGKSGNASQVISQVNQFAAANGLLEGNAQQAAKSLLAFGTPLGELEGELSQVADISAATGKDFNELVTIFGKARVAGVLYAEDINQLVDAGVPIIEEFAKALGKPASEVKKLASEGQISFGTLQTAFKALTSEGGKFAGLAREQAKVTGDAARATAEWSKFLRGVGDVLVPIRNAGLSIFSGILGAVNNLIGATPRLTAQLENERQTFGGLAVAALNANEGSKARAGLIRDLQAQYPKYLGSLDAEKVTNEQLKPILDKINNAYVVRIALQKTQEQIQPLLEQQAATELRLANNRVGFNRALARGAELAGVNITAYKTEQEQFEAVTDALRKKAEADGPSFFPTEAQKTFAALRQQQSLVGFGIEDQVNRTKQVTQAEQQRQQVIEQLRKTYGDLVDDVVGANEAQAGGTGGGGGAGTKTAEQRKKEAEELFKAEQERAKLRADLLTNTVEREKALEKIRYTEQVKTLRESFAGRAELTGLEADALAQHTANLQRIQDDADNEALLKEVEALRAKDEARRQAFENEIAQAEAQAALLEGVEQQKAERIAAAQRQEQEARDTGQPLEAQVKIQEQLTRDLQEIETKAAQTRTAQKIEAFRATQEVELAEFESAQAQYLAKYATERGVTEEQIKIVEDEISKARKLFLLEQERAVLEYQLSLGEGLADQQRQQIRAQLEAVQAEIQTATAAIGKEGGKGFNIFTLLGANTEQEKGAIKQAAAEITAAIEQITAARRADADAAKEAADKNVEAAQQELDNQLKLADLGFASDVDRAKIKLETEKAAQNAALENQKRVARQQLAVDTAQQISSLVTASARIFAEGAKFFPVGIALSIAGIATLFATMSSVRARARAINAGQFREGGQGYVDSNGIVRAPSHEHGGVKIAELEGDEFFTSDGQRFAVVNKKMTAKHFALLTAINADDREGMKTALSALVDLPKMDIQAVGQHVTYKAQSTVQGGFDLAERRAIIGLLKKVEGKKPEQRKTVTRTETGLTIQKGNRTRTITNA